MLTGGAAVVGSAAGAVLSGSTSAEAANGNALLAGRADTATATTSLTNSSTSGGAHGLVVSTKGGYGFQASSASNHGVAGITTGASKAGVIATPNGPAGSGAALVADGRKNAGAIVKNSGTATPALRVRSSFRNSAAKGTAIDAIGDVGVHATGRYGLLAGDRNPQGRLGKRASHRGRAGQAEERTGYVPLPEGARQPEEKRLGFTDRPS